MTERPPLLRLAACQVDLATRRTWREGVQGHLTSTEAALLAALVERPDEVVTRGALMARVWGAPTGDDRVVDAMMRKLRRKLERDPRRPEHLQTVHGHGFRFVPLAAPRVTLRGRDALRAEVAALLAEGEPVTLTGPGGIGKTAFARHVASDHGTAAFCELVDCHTEDDVLQVVAGALGVSAPDPERVGDALAARAGTLLVLDNLEQLPEAARRSVGSWHRPGGAAWLCTSRAALRSPGERVVELPPLAGEAAAALFGQRVEQAAGWTPRAGPALDAVLVALEGVPLALELAAARCRVLDLPTLASQLQSRPHEVLGRPGDEGRHGSMARAVAWSWGLCAPRERDALAELTVFRGGFTVQAALEVVDVGAPVLDVLDALRHQSLLRAEPSDGPTRRLHLFEAVRTFVEGQPGTGERVSGASPRHAAWFSAWSAAHTDGVEPLRDEATRDALLAEWWNLRQALALSAGRPGQAAPIALALAALRHHRPTPAAALRVPVDGLDPSLAARVLYARARQRRLTDPADAQHIARRATAIAQGAFRGRCVGLQGLIAYDAGDLAAAEPLRQEALDIAREHADPLGEVYALGDLGRIAHVRGQLDEAERLYTEALALGQTIGDRSVRGLNTDVLAWLLLQRGEVERAETRFRQAIDLHIERHELRHEAVSRLGLGTLLGTTERLAEAVRELDAALTTAARMADRAVALQARVQLALVRYLADHPDPLQELVGAEHSVSGLSPALAALVHHARGLLHQASGAPAMAARELEQAAALLDGSGRYEEAAVSMDLAALRAHPAVSLGSPADGPDRLATRHDLFEVVRRSLR